MSEALRQVSLVFLVTDNDILLAMKKRGFGEGRWNGVGGKPDGNETIEQTAIRECQEEILVTPHSLGKVAVLNFYFPEAKAAMGFNQQAHVYFCSEWTGESAETEEMLPKWFAKESVPYKEMWPDDIYWLPKVLAGEQIEADFYFDSDDNVTSFDIRPLIT